MSNNKKRRADDNAAATKPEVRFAIRVCYDGPFDAAILSAPIDHPSVKRVKAALRSLAELDYQSEGPAFSQFLAARLIDVYQQRKIEPMTLDWVQRVHPQSTSGVRGTFEPIDPHKLITDTDRAVWQQREDELDLLDEPKVVYQLASISCAE